MKIWTWSKTWSFKKKKKNLLLPLTCATTHVLYFLTIWAVLIYMQPLVQYEGTQTTVTVIGVGCRLRENCHRCLGIIRPHIWIFSFMFLFSLTVLVTLYPARSEHQEKLMPLWSTCALNLHSGPPGGDSCGFKKTSGSIEGYRFLS